MINDPLIAAALLGFAFGVFVGMAIMNMIRQYSHMKKLQDEFEADRARFRAEFEAARKRMMP